MPLDFQITGADDGYNDEESIQPYENGEAAEETIFRRPPENLRNRTEVIRKAVDDAFLVNSADRGWLLVAHEGVQVTWNGNVLSGGDGKWTISSGSLYLTPITSSGERDVKNDIAARLAYKIGTDSYFEVRSYHEGGAEIRAYNGANNLRLELFYVAGVTFPSDTPQITVEGSNDGGTYDPALGPVLIRVQLSHDTAIRSTWAQVAAELNADLVAGTFVRAFVEPTGGAGYADVIDAQFLWEGVGTDVSGTGAVDAQSVTITKAQIDAFFSTGGGSAGMENGDAIVVEFEAARDRLDAAGNATFGSALRLIHRNEVDTADDDDGFSSVGTAFQGNSIPLCKVFANDLWFSNGTVIKKDQTGYIRLNDAMLRDQLASQTPTVGAALVGNDALSGVNYSHGAGTVDAHLSAIFGDVDGLKTEYDDHVAGTADQHPLSDIAARPFIVVGTDGDYTDLETAIETLAAGTGGTIFVRRGIYDINADITSMNDTVRIIGEPGGSLGNYTEGVVIRPSTLTAAAIQISDTSPQGKLIFEHIKFHANGITTASMLKFPYANPNFDVEFRNCCFFKKFSTSAYAFAQCGCNVLFEDCRMLGNSWAENVPFFEGYAPTGYGPSLRFIFNRCQFTLWGQLVRLGGTGDEEIGYFQFTNNFMYEVGYSASASSAGLLIATDAGANYRVHMNIQNNYWPEDSGASAGNDGLFCDMVGSGVIANNRLMHGLRGAGMNAGFYAIRVLGLRSGIDADIDVCHNQISGVFAGCIELVGKAKAIGNKCSTQPATAPTFGIKVGDSSSCIGNYVNYSSSISSGNNPAIKAGSISGAGHMRIQGNTVYLGNNAYHDGIHVGDDSYYSTDVTVDGNEVRGSTYNNAVYVAHASTARVTISGNTFYYCKSGVVVGAGCNQVITNNNNITLSAITGIDGIYYPSGADEGAIVGNVIRGRNTGDTGITCAADDCVIAGNAIVNFNTKFNVTGDSGIGTTSSRDTTHNLY